LAGSFVILKSCPVVSEGANNFAIFLTSFELKMVFGKRDNIIPFVMRAVISKQFL
jgi:hypothetical protein